MTENSSDIDNLPAHPWPGGRNGALDRALHEPLEYREITLLKADHELPAEIVRKSPAELAETYRISEEQARAAQGIIQTWLKSPHEFEVSAVEKSHAPQAPEKTMTRTIFVDGQEIIVSGDNSRQ